MYITITKIDLNIYRCISKDIKMDEVVITDVQLKHIEERHPETLAYFHKYAEQILTEPDYILENRPYTGLILKEIEEENARFQLVLRVCVPTDPDIYKNSVITFTKVREKEWNRLLRNKKILYRKA